MKWVHIVNEKPMHGDYVLAAVPNVGTEMRIFLTQYHDDWGFCTQPYFTIADVRYWAKINPPKTNEGID